MHSAKLAPNNFLRRSAINKVFLHELPNVKELFEVVADEKELLPDIIEKDYFMAGQISPNIQLSLRFEEKSANYRIKMANLGV